MSGCAMHHLQTPEVLPKGKTAGGLGMAVVPIEGTFFVPFPGFWVRTGVAPHFDIGVKPWFLGLEVDGKYGFNDYFAIGGGVGLAFPLVLLYSAEVSIYGGIPIGEVLYPYAVLRGKLVGGALGDVEIGGEGVSMIGSRASGVLGLRLRLGKNFSVYGEGGAVLPLGVSSSVGSTGIGEPTALFGLGVSIGY
jgi:hypothetical protein